MLGIIKCDVYIIREKMRDTGERDGLVERDDFFFEALDFISNAVSFESIHDLHMYIYVYTFPKQFNYSLSHSTVFFFFMYECTE